MIRKKQIKKFNNGTGPIHSNEKLREVSVVAKAPTDTIFNPITYNLNGKRMHGSYNEIPTIFKDEYTRLYNLGIKEEGIYEALKQKYSIERKGDMVVYKRPLKPVPSYNNGLMGNIMSSYGASIGMNKDLKWNDYTSTEKGLVGGAMGAQAATGVAGLVGSAMSLADKDPSRYTKSDKSAGVVTGAASGAMSGASALSFLGPAGIIAGAVGGGLIGGIKAGKEGNAALEQQASSDRVSAIGNSMTQISNAGKNLETRSHKKIGIPGMDKGVYKFYSNKDRDINAKIASEEAVVSPDGSVDVVPGKYNKSNPDTTYASLQDGTSILPKNPAFRLPHGKSTPADIGKKIASIQKKADSIEGKKNGSFIDSETAKLNKKNTDIAIDALNIYSESIRQRMSKKIKPGISSYNLGTTGFVDNDEEDDPANERDPENVVQFDRYGERELKWDDEDYFRLFGRKKPLAHRVNSRTQPVSIDKDGLLKNAAISMAVGASLAQARNAIPETISPEEYIPTKHKYRSDLFNQLRDIQARENIARFNNKVAGGGAYSGILNTALNRSGSMSRAAAYEANQKGLLASDNMNRSELSRIRNMNTQEKIRVKDLNMRSRAVARNIKYAAFQDIAKTILPRVQSQTQG